MKLHYTRKQMTEGKRSYTAGRAMVVGRIIDDWLEQDAELERLEMVLRMSRNEHAKSLTRNREEYAGATGDLREAVAAVVGVFWSSPLNMGEGRLYEEMGNLRRVAGITSPPADEAITIPEGE